MKERIYLKIILAVVLTTFMVFSSITPLTFGQKSIIKNEEQMDESYVFDRYNKYALMGHYSPEIHIPNCQSNDFRMETLPVHPGECESLKLKNQKETPILTEVSNNDSLDSPWPMYCHDTRHTGRSPYSTAGNPGIEKWKFDTNDNEVTGSPVIDEEGIIYIGASELFAVYPNGTKKWKYNKPIIITSAPAIDENGILYVGSIRAHPNYFYAIYMSNGTLKWKYQTGGDVRASPAIGDDGIIYFCDMENWKIKALYPNGTLKWSYKTNHVIYSSPAIGIDGTIYCGSHDGNLYAFYPENGTLRWKYMTGDWVARGACIADDGTIYFGSWDGYLYACYPNGTLKWKSSVYFGTTPVVGHDGTIYGGCYYLYAINPENGSIIWYFDPGEDRTIRGGNPCISSEGIIYFGTHIGDTDGGELIAVNPDGTERWRIMLATDWIWSAPAIGEDGTVYVGSYNDGYHPGSWGYLHAIGPLEPNAPSAPSIKGKTSGTAGKDYEYTFKSTSPLSREVYYYIDWGDNTIKNWFGPFNSGEVVTVTHTYSDQGTYTIKARAKDTENLWGPWGNLEIIMPKNKATYNSLFIHLLQKFLLLK